MNPKTIGESKIKSSLLTANGAAGSNFRREEMNQPVESVKNYISVRLCCGKPELFYLGVWVHINVINSI